MKKSIETDYELLMFLMEYEAVNNWWIPLMYFKPLQKLASYLLYKKTVNKFKKVKSFRKFRKKPN